MPPRSTSLLLMSFLAACAHAVVKDEPPADTGDTATTPRVDCGFVDWGTAFDWPATSLDLAAVTRAEGDAREAYIGSPELATDPEGGLRMVLDGGGSDGVGRIVEASAPGVEGPWTRTGAVLEPGGAWATAFLDTPAALFVDGVERVYYFGNDTNTTAEGGRIGLATWDGTTWGAPAGDAPVLSPGPSGSWDALWVESPVVLPADDGYRMWFTGVDAQWRVRHGVASSADGLAWTEDPESPVVSPSDDASASTFFFPGGPGVVRAPGGTYLMFFACMSADDYQASPPVANLCLATSPDGRTFTMYPDDDDPTPIVPRSWFQALEQDGVVLNGGPINPAVILEQDTFHLYYENQASYFGHLTLPVCAGM